MILGEDQNIHELCFENGKKEANVWIKLNYTTSVPILQIYKKVILYVFRFINAGSQGAVGAYTATINVNSKRLDVISG